MSIRILGVVFALMLAFVSLGTPGVSAHSGSATTTVRVNMRTGPGTGYSTIRTLSSGTRVYVVSGLYNGSWAKVSHDGRTGYVYNPYLRYGSSGGSGGGSNTSSGWRFPVNSIYRCGSTPGEWTYYGQYHDGFDVCSRTSRSVYAPFSGRVMLGGSGIGVYITGNGMRDNLHHLVNISVSDGQYVSKGQYIGTYAQVGVSRSPHLHWVRWLNRNGSWVQQSSWSAYGF